MSIFVEKDGKKTLPGYIYIKTLLFFTLIIVSAIVMHPVQAAFKTAMSQIRVDLIEKLEEFTKLEIRYASLRPSFFGTFDIREIKFLTNNEPFMEISRVRMHFSIPELLLRKKTFIHTIQIERPAVTIDMERDADTLEHLISLIRTDDTLPEIIRQISEFLPQDANYLIRSGNMIITNDKTAFLMEDMNLNIWGKDGDIFLAGRFLAESIISDVFNRTLKFKADIGIDASSNSTLDDAVANIALYYLTCAEQETALFAGKKEEHIFTVNPANFTFLFKDNLLSLDSENSEKRVTDNENKTEYVLRYNIETGFLLTKFNFDNFLLADKISFTDKWKEASHLLQMQLTGNASFLRETDLMEYSISLNGANIQNALNDNFLIDFYGNNESLNINNFIIKFSPDTAKAGLFQGEVNINGNTLFSPFKPQGTIIFDGFSLSPDRYGYDSLNTALRVRSTDSEIQISSDRVTISRSRLNDIKLFLYPTQRDLAVSFSAFFNNDGAVYLDAVYNINPRELESSLVLSSVSLFDVLEIARPFNDYFRLQFVSYLQDAMIDAEFFFSTDFNNIVFNAPNILLEKDGAKGMISLSATDRQLTVSEGIFLINENELLFSAGILYSNPMDLAFTVNVNYLNMSWNLEGQLFDKTNLIISDSHGLNIYGNLSNERAISGYIEGIDYPVPVNRQIVYTNFFMNLRYDSPVSWNLGINHITAREQQSADGNDFLRISGEADQNGASFRELVYSDSAGILSGNADFIWSEDFSDIDFLININDGREIGELYYLEGSLKDSQINVQASVYGMKINRFAKSSTPILLNADAAVSWDSVNSFNAQIKINTFDARLPRNILLGSGEININNDELMINDFVMEFGEFKTELPLLLFNCSEGRALAIANINGLAFERKIEGNIDFKADFEKINSWLDIRRALGNFSGTLGVDNLNYNNESHDPFVFVFSSDNGALSVSGGIRDMFRLEMDNTGNFFAGLSAPLPVRCSVVGTFKDGIVDARLNNFYFDLAALWSMMVRLPEFTVRSGYITGSIDIRGHILNPEFYGTGRGNSFRFHVPAFSNDEIKPVPFLIHAEGYEMTFGPVVVASGNGGAAVNGWFLFENWLPVNIGLDIDVPRETPIPYDLNIFGFLARGTASGKFNLNIDTLNSMMQYTGDLFTNNAELGMNVDELAANTEMEIYDDITVFSVVDIRITLGSAVEFVWPTTSPILRANPELGTVVYVSSDNRAGVLSLISDVRIRSGELFYFDRSFYIREGFLVFRENERQFDPIFSTRAEVRDRADDGPVTISMIVENQPLFSFEPRFESNPGLSQLEIYSILGQNLNSIQGFENADLAQRFLLTSTTSILTQFIATSGAFAQFAFLRNFERFVRDLFGLDMLSVRTRFIENAVVSGASGFTQDDPLDRNGQIGNYFDNTTVFIGKYIGHDMFIHGMLTMRYDENSSLLGGLKLEPDFGIELQSPIINIRWDFFPYHPENLWVSGNSITLSWSRSF